jgi:hypothetical protein
MKRIALLIFISGFIVSAKAQSGYFMDEKSQYAIAKDTDGFVNIRKSPNKDAPIIGRIYNYNVFTCDATKTNWWKVLYIQPINQTKSDFLEGYIYKNHVLMLTDWKSINKKDSLIVSIKKTPFIPKKHKLTYFKEESSRNSIRELQKIDSKFFWGTDGEVPKEVITSVEVSINGAKVSIPKIAFDDLYGPHWGNVNICYGPEKTLYIRMDNSDGAGAYTIIWVIKDSKYYSRYIDDSND